MRLTTVVGIRRDRAVEIEPGIFEEVIDQFTISGNLTQQPVRWSGGDIVQQTPAVNHTFSFIAKDQLIESFSNAVYVEWMGERWVVVSFTYLKPRVTLVLGGRYHG